MWTIYGFIEFNYLAHTICAFIIGDIKNPQLKLYFGYHDLGIYLQIHTEMLT